MLPHLDASPLCNQPSGRWEQELNTCRGRRAERWLRCCRGAAAGLQDTLPGECLPFLMHTCTRVPCAVYSLPCTGCTCDLGAMRCADDVMYDGIEWVKCVLWEGFS